MDKKTRAKLAAAAADGDTSAFAKLYEQVYRQLYYYALSNLQSPDDAADAVQDAALQAFAGIASLREPSAFDSWIFRILMNIVKQKQKNYAITREHSLDADPSAVIGGSPFGRVEMLSALNELSPEERQCLTLYGAAGYNSKEIAELTGMKASTVRSHISRGREKLRKALKHGKGR